MRLELPADPLGQSRGSSGKWGVAVGKGDFRRAIRTFVCFQMQLFEDKMVLTFRKSPAGAEASTYVVRRTFTGRRFRPRSMFYPPASHRQ